MIDWDKIGTGSPNNIYIDKSTRYYTIAFGQFNAFRLWMKLILTVLIDILLEEPLHLL